METIYEFVSKTNKKSCCGKKLDLYKCKVCGNYFLKRSVHVKGIKKCCHNNIKHHTNDLSKTRLYRIYKNMISRCYNKKNKDYKFYGSKEIKMCDAWLNDFKLFYNWAMGNGYQDNLTIDRINNNGNYEPNNCRWITQEENSRFKSTTNYITINNITKSGIQWAYYIGKSKNYINRMIKSKGLNYTISYIKQNL